jgi:hypothetical protein
MISLLTPPYVDGKAGMKDETHKVQCVPEAMSIPGDRAACRIVRRSANDRCAVPEEFVNHPSTSQKASHSHNTARRRRLPKRLQSVARTAQRSEAVELWQSPCRALRLYGEANNVASSDF